VKPNQMGTNFAYREISGHFARYSAKEGGVQRDLRGLSFEKNQGIMTNIICRHFTRQVEKREYRKRGVVLKQDIDPRSDLTERRRIEERLK